MAEVYLLVCDACAKAGEQRVEATSTLRLDVDGVAIAVDVCDRHDGEFGAVLRTLQEIGRPEIPAANPRRPARAGRKPDAELVDSIGAAGCPVEGCGKVLSTPGNMAHHVRKIHLRKPEEWTPEQRKAATENARRLLRRSLLAAEQS